MSAVAAPTFATSRGSAQSSSAEREFRPVWPRSSGMRVLLTAFLGAGGARAFVQSPVPYRTARLSVMRSAIETPTPPAERPIRQMPLDPRSARVSTLPPLPPLRLPVMPEDITTPLTAAVPRAPPAPVKPRPAVTPDDDADDRAYHERWRARRTEELLQMLELQASTVNELLAPDHLQRQRHILKPEEAFGCIFQLDVLTDVAEGLLAAAWADVAKEYNKPAPDLKQVQRSMGMLPENAILREFRWTQNFAEAKKLVLDFAQVVNRMAAGYKAKELPGVRKWLEQLRAQGVECAVVSHLPAAVVKAAMESSGLKEFFKAEVAAEDVFERDSTAFLKASLKMGRAPFHCAVFDCRPAGMMEAHEADMRGVALVGTFPVYELSVADATTRRMDELLVYNVRRLFADRSYESSSPSAPQLQMQPEAAPKRQRRTLTRQEFRQ